MLLYRAWRYRLLKDVAEIQYLRKNLKKGDIAVDIGAHKGGYLYWMLKRVKSVGRCYAFEPQPVLYNYLKNLKYKNVLQHLIVENKGVSSTRSGFRLYIPKTKKGSSPSATLNLPTEETEDQFTNVQIESTTLDHYFFEENIFPDLIKIDVEGHELEVLKGGRNLLSTHPPKIIIECEQRHLQDHKIQEVFDFLLEKNYKGFFIYGRKKKPLEEFDIEVHQKIGEGRFWEAKGYVNNFIFEPKYTRSKYQ